MEKRIRSFKYAGRGIKKAISSEVNIRIHLAITLGVVIAGFILEINTIEWMICLLCFGMVLGLEMLNTAIEKTVDLASPNLHPLAGSAKDIAAGGVLISAITAACIGMIIFTPKLIDYFNLA
jgi:diacylglycerol kinase (ATP)